MSSKMQEIICTDNHRDYRHHLLETFCTCNFVGRSLKICSRYSLMNLLADLKADKT